MTAMRPDGADATQAAKGLVNGHVELPVLGGPEHTDYYLLHEELTDEQRGLCQRVRRFMDQEVIPIINPYWERAEFPHELIPTMAESLPR
jgi:glutaryl-CoA dehydrogenase